MTKPGSKDDFASAAMMRLVVAGLARQGIQPAIHPPGGAHVPRREKQSALVDVLNTHGPLAILRISDAMPEMSAEPLLIALSRARNLADLLDRWHRLEQFSHRRHSVRVTDEGHGAFTLTHHSRDAGPAPSLAESLLVFGVLVTLAEMIGLADVTMLTESGKPLREGRKWAAPTAGDLTQRVTLSAETANTKPAQPPTHPGDALIETIRHLIMSDPLHRWKVRDLACHVGLSTRSLQRRLSERGQSTSRLLVEARVSVASEYLCNEKGPGLAEIGFLTGFSDQAHFSRTFRHSVGTSPIQYRAAFQPEIG
jgi:AraC-like DNA-binding protein